VVAQLVAEAQDAGRRDAARAHHGRVLGPDCAGLIGHYACGAGVFGKARRFAAVVRAQSGPSTRRATSSRFELTRASVIPPSRSRPSRAGIALVSSNREDVARRVLGPDCAGLIGHYACGAGVFRA
jgi:succinyl-CoA synthetase alpha subunit